MAAAYHHLQLGKLLYSLGICPGEPDPAILEDESEFPIRRLCRLHGIDESKAIEKVAKRLSLEVIDLNKEGAYQSHEIEALSPRIQADFCWSKKILPLREENFGVTVACANPLDYESIKTLQFSLAKPIRPLIAHESRIISLLRKYYPHAHLHVEQGGVAGSGRDFETHPLLDSTTEEAGNPDAPPAIQLCNKILADAIRGGASDIHLEPTQQSLEVRFRIDGAMQKVFDVPQELQSHLISRFKIIAGMNIAERRRPQDGRVRVKIGGEAIDLRVSCVPASHGENMVLRVLRADQQMLSFSHLGMPQVVESAFRRVLDSPGRLVIVTGPTGSGKTTTLYAALNYLKDGHSNIVTVEDPIEYRLSGINQIQVNRQIDVSFASTLRSILRQDPDVIMIGEIRDAETAEIAMQAAQTGHLVLSTLHTNDAPSAISRLVSLGVKPQAVASTLAGVIAQRLVRRVCSECARALGAAERAAMREQITSYGLDDLPIISGNGCELCSASGYKGRVGLYSFLEVTPAVSQVIHQEGSIHEICDVATNSGFSSLDRCARDALGSGTTSFAEVKPYLSIRTTDAPRAADLTSSPSTPKRTEGAVERIKVLVVEDDEEVRTVIRMLLQREMFEVFEARNGAEALDRVFDSPPHLVLCDLMMPVMNGREFLRKMRSHHGTAAIPIVVLTAVDTDENEVDLLDLGAVDFISKTSSSAVMLSRIRKILERSLPRPDIHRG